MPVPAHHHHEFATKQGEYGGEYKHEGDEMRCHQRRAEQGLAKKKRLTFRAKRMEAHALSPVVPHKSMSEPCVTLTNTCAALACG
jgi:hypothetical protein